MRAATVIALLCAVTMALEISSPVVTIFPGVMSGKWRVLRTPDYPNGDMLGVSLTVIGDQYAAIGVSWASMAGPIVACHVDSDAQAVCKNVMGMYGGGLSPTMPPQTVKVVNAYLNNNFRTVEFVVRTSAVNLTTKADPELVNSRLIFAHGHWDAAKQMPTVHGAHNKTVLFSSVYQPTVSPVFDVFPGAMNVQWRVHRNSEDAGGDTLAVVLTVFSFSGDAFTGMGFSPMSMYGPIVACNIPGDGFGTAVCKNFVGMNGGGISPTLPPQTVKVLWSTVDADRRSVEFEVPLSALNLTDPKTTFSRLIFAHGMWDATKQMPTYHGPNNTVLHANLYTGEIRSDMAVDTTWSAMREPFSRGALQGVDVSWRLHLNGTGPEFSFIDIYLKLNTVGQYFVEFGWLTSNFTGVAVVASYQPGTPFTVTDADVTGYQGPRLPGQGNLEFMPASQQVSVPILGMEFDGSTHMIFRTPLSRAPISNAPILSFIAAADIGSQSFPDEANTTFWFDLNYYQNTIAEPRTPVIQLLGGVMTAQWRLLEFISQTASDILVEVTLSLVGAYGNFMGIGNSPYNMYGTIVACHVNYMDPTDVTCRDFIGQDGGGVKVAPVQSTIVVGSSHDNGVSTVTFVTSIKAFNLTWVEAFINPVRLIFAHGAWDSAKQEPIYHGPNNCTIRHLNFATGEPVAPTAPPQERGRLPSKVSLPPPRKIERVDAVVRALEEEADRRSRLGFF